LLAPGHEPELERYKEAVEFVQQPSYFGKIQLEAGQIRERRTYSGGQTRQPGRTAGWQPEQDGGSGLSSSSIGNEAQATSIGNEAAA
jgi:hypothetical protein